MNTTVCNDIWLSNELQTIYNETFDKKTRLEIKKGFINFEKRLIKQEINYISPKLFIDSTNNSRHWKTFEKISKGELILSERASCWDLLELEKNLKDSAFYLWKRLIKKCIKDRNLLKSMKLLFPRNQNDINRIKKESDKYKIPLREIKSYLEIDEIENIMSINEAMRLYLVVKYNQMCIQLLPELWDSPFKWSKYFSICGLFIRSSFFDHSCSPNVIRFYIGTVAVFKAIRIINPGESLSISYIENEFMCDPLWVRYAELNFWCKCKLCIEEVQINNNLNNNNIDNNNNEEDHHIIQSINLSKEEYPRCSLITQNYIDMLHTLKIEERMFILEEIINDRFVRSKKNKSMLVCLDAIKLIGIIIFDCFSIGDLDKARYWLDIILRYSKIKDESIIPLKLMSGLISKNEKDQISCFKSAISIYKIIFGNNVRFFMKRYWSDIRHIIMFLNFDRRERYSYLRKISRNIRRMFLNK